MRSFRIILALTIYVLLFATSGASAQTLYGATNVTGQFYSIDANTGAATPIGAPSLSLTGMAFDPLNGVLYGMSNGGSLVTIDPTTGVRTPIGFSFTGGGDISFRSDGTLFLLTHGFATGLYTVNLTTGLATFVGNPGPIPGDALAFNPSDTLYGTAGSGLAIIDPATGANMGSMAFSGAPQLRMNAFTFDSSGTLFASNISSPVGTTNLVTINTSNGAVTNIGTMPAHMDSLAFSVPVAVPEPSTWELGGLSLLALLWMRLRARKTTN